MSSTIAEPLDSKQMVLILNRIIEMDDPYLSSLGEHLEKEVGAIQKYTNTMIEKGWITKEKDGRKAIFEFQPVELWKDYPKLPKLANRWDELDKRVQEFLKFALRFKLIYAVSETAKPEKTQVEGWTKATDIGLGTDKPVYLRPENTLRELLQENADRVLNFEALLSHLDKDSERGLDRLYAHESAYAEAYLKMMNGEWGEEEIKDFTNQVEENPYDYF